MADRTIPLPGHVLRSLVAPAFLGALGALLAAGTARILRRVRRPSLPRMSDEWLRSHNADSGYSPEFWRDSL